MAQAERINREEEGACCGQCLVGKTTFLFCQISRLLPLMILKLFLGSKKSIREHKSSLSVGLSSTFTSLNKQRVKARSEAWCIQEGYSAVLSKEQTTLQSTTHNLSLVFSVSKGNNSSEFYLLALQACCHSEASNQPQRGPSRPRRTDFQLLRCTTRFPPWTFILKIK
jgi:hypothetical protein